LKELLGAQEGDYHFLERTQLQKTNVRVYRLRFAGAGKIRSLVAKRLQPGIAQRNELVATRWLPAVGLAECGPRLLGVAAERGGQCVWHVYEDLGDWALDADDPDPVYVEAAVRLIASVHTRFSEHALLAECRLHGGDLGIGFFTSNVRDAIRGLQSLGTTRLELTPEQQALCQRLLERLHHLLEELPERTEALAEMGGPETLLHGDLWTTNIFVRPTPDGLEARLIDWDHAAVGPASYDISTFLFRFPREHRQWILESYRQAVSQEGWQLPGDEDLNRLFETAELARYANHVIWPTIALAKGCADWAFDQLAEVERWFVNLEPVLSIARDPSDRDFVQQ
jgi:hypothetical protein